MTGGPIDLSCFELPKGYRCGVGQSGETMILGPAGGEELTIPEAIRRGIARRVAG